MRPSAALQIFFLHRPPFPLPFLSESWSFVFVISTVFGRIIGERHVCKPRIRGETTLRRDFQVGATSTQAVIVIHSLPITQIHQRVVMAIKSSFSIEEPINFHCKLIVPILKK
jgi:hypothetical protein